MKNILTIAFTVLTIATAFGQTTKYTGYFCTGASVDDNSPLKYTREYKQDGDVFTTLYKIYSPTDGYYLNITATHYKSEKKIVVSIDDITVSKEFGHISTQEITYDEPSMKMFGYANALRANGMDEQGRLPNDLGLKFASIKFQNIKVVHIVKDSSTLKWYVLDEKN